MPRVGDRFGPYELVAQIAAGGMAEVYLARSVGVSGFEKYVALKIVHSKYSQDPHFAQMLVEEAKIAVYLTHVNIVQVFDLGRIGDTYYIAMEYVDGADLYRIMRALTERGIQMPPGVAAYVVHEVCSGLDYAHRCRDQLGNPLHIIHRDMSPQNVLVSRAGEVKVADFGIAKAAFRATKTEVGVIKGKFYYMSPEQAWGKPLDQRTDVFSTGIVLYEMLAGRMLYLEQDMGRLLKLVRRAEIPPLRERRPDVPEELERITMKALARDPKDRWQTAQEFGQALQRYVIRFHPDFSVQEVQKIVELALESEEPQTKVERPLARSGLRPFSREDILSLAEHSLLFSSAEGAEPRADEDFEEATVVSGPPVFFGPTGEVEGDPALPVTSGRRGPDMEESLPQWVLEMVESLPGGQGIRPDEVQDLSDWSEEDEEEPTRVMPGRATPEPRPAGWDPQGGLQGDGPPVEIPGFPQNQSPGDASGQMPLPPPPPAHESPGQYMQPMAQASSRQTPDPWGEGMLSVGLDSEELGAIRPRGGLWLKLLVAGALVAGVVAMIYVFSPVFLGPKTGALRVETVPSGATVRVDGEMVPGRTPLTVEKLDPDRAHTVEVRKPGYEPVEITVWVDEGETAKRVIELRPAGSSWRVGQTGGGP